MHKTGKQQRKHHQASWNAQRVRVRIREMWPWVEYKHGKNRTKFYIQHHQVSLTKKKQSSDGDKQGERYNASHASEIKNKKNSEQNKGLGMEKDMAQVWEMWILKPRQLTNRIEDWG